MSSKNNQLSIASVPPVQRSRSLRDLQRAEWLRPRDIMDIYGIPSSTLHELATREDEALRLPSTLIPGRRGKRGLRLVERVALDAYLRRFSAGAKGAPAVALGTSANLGAAEAAAA